MAQIIRERRRVTHTKHEVCFYEMATDEVRWAFPLLYGKGAMVVPCREKGPNEYEACSEDECPWWKNYLRAKEDDSLYKREEEFSWTGTEPAVAICECGKEIALNYDAEECEHCGRLHNLFGQELRPRKYWNLAY